MRDFATSAFAVPRGREATAPPEARGLSRDAVRLLVTERTTGRHRDRFFRDLAALLRRGDLVVVNDSTTLPAALQARRADGTVFPLHLSSRIRDDLWIAEPRAPVAAGTGVVLAEGATATFLIPLDEHHPRLWYVGLVAPAPFDAYLARQGRPIRYRYVTEDLPLAAYQTIFARVPGSAEMPSASRPFSTAVVAGLEAAGIALATITLHAGVSSPERHERPFREPFVVPAHTAAAVNATHARGGRVVAAGTTVVRALETAVEDGVAIAASGWTATIVTPERGLGIVDALLTGFHEPQASHLDLLRALVDDDALRAAYVHAAEGGYRWHEFGDVHLLV